MLVKKNYLSNRNYCHNLQIDGIFKNYKLVLSKETLIDRTVWITYNNNNYYTSPEYKIQFYVIGEIPKEFSLDIDYSFPKSHYMHNINFELCDYLGNVKVQYILQECFPVEETIFKGKKYLTITFENYKKIWT